ncbi:hypothetical protein MRB53_016230 [Persea americana]|uniref:Uncharacterized protein n=1 Tax=Persea americana TaxID=3435 RepID=A0ACC2M182_PERAE|nr:hypothetical protein MRB53_016230 [Persea americana]
MLGAHVDGMDVLKVSEVEKEAIDSRYWRGKTQDRTTFQWPEKKLQTIEEPIIDSSTAVHCVSPSLTPLAAACRRLPPSRAMPSPDSRKKARGSRPILVIESLRKKTTCSRLVLG